MSYDDSGVPDNLDLLLMEARLILSTGYFFPEVTAPVDAAVDGLYLGRPSPPDDLGGPVASPKGGVA